MAGRPSIRNIHCQPRNPKPPCVASMIQPDSGPPTITPSGIARNRNAMTFASRCDGNHTLKYAITAGKKLASVTPSRKRNA
ncbi:Uncharacterised protein [Burkholderia cenocepacia]|nr:Uncharacterised protein [Burkholderia cenocepacia]